MDSEMLNDWLQIFGILAIVASLVFVGLQVKQSRSMGEGAKAVAWMEVAVSARKAIASHSDVWVKGCTGDELSAAENAVEFAGIVDARLEESREIDPDPVFDARCCGM